MTIDNRYPWMKAVSECPANVEAIARKIASRTGTNVAYNPRTGQLLFYHSNMAFCYPGLLVCIPQYGWALPDEGEIGRYVSLINRAKAMTNEDADRFEERAATTEAHDKAESIGREDENLIKQAEDVIGHADRKLRGVERVVA